MPELELEKPILDDWRQGDFVLGAIELPVMTHDADGFAFGGSDAVGAVLISQSCDIVRSHLKRPFVQIAGLASASLADIARIEKGLIPQYGFLEPLRQHGLVVDFDVVATIEKTALHSLARSVGCTDESERRKFSSALARHKRRFAFPDSFNRAINPLRRWIERRDEQQNDTGALIRAIAQIRVFVRDWEDATSIELICILRHQPTNQQLLNWEAPVDAMLAILKASYPLGSIRLLELHELSAAEFVRSDRLDLDGLSDA